MLIAVGRPLIGVDGLGGALAQIIVARKLRKYILEVRDGGNRSLGSPPFASTSAESLAALVK